MPGFPNGRECAHDSGWQNCVQACVCVYLCVSGSLSHMLFVFVLIEEGGGGAVCG